MQVMAVGEAKEASLLLHKCEHISHLLHRQWDRRCRVLGVFFFPPSPFFYIFSLVTASLISLDLKPPRETGRERYRRKMRGGKKNPASNLVKVSFEKSIFLCDKICLRLFVL